ncbi:MAG TPA: glutamate-1-semialdehyde 2,1-aminomutase [Candidatus Hydrogenedentes bacterium]|nr:glutamate-1-semialdehyde 2,1-aminomutase [Candidatus Hydrogenedentota bacterium]HPC14833.1 glutamate-1-semialdehyde 2,1-aminomutase [Candidatus Hydrogenedentota bacterium]HRT18697.1 glutamate-1-semialdehyde 2,1-aminomutase [Candidatus Hydrogenedentota bacterium]HRT63717.1 glutamate-1-semialdehyde 2,1-aminomutase [Candidatus Hydrogenedentota bacterium]
MKSDVSAKLWREANQVLVGGVNSPVRAFKAVGGNPFFAVSGKGAVVTDADGNEYIDYVLSWGPLVLGHAHPVVVEAVRKALEKGSSFGIPTEAEIRLAERIRQIMPSIEKVRLVNSGTEATMSAIRLARGFTGRDLIVKLEGCYHGHADGLLVKAGSGLATLGIPASPGIPAAYAQCTLTAPYNDLDAMRAVFDTHGANIACIILEPVVGNAGVILPEPGYLQGLRDLTKRHGALLIFDEVMSGFRAALGGAQARYGITPDLTTLGKVIGGGLPVGAYGGPAAIMDHLAPVGPVYQAGTLAGNPLATAAGLATLEVLAEPGAYESTENALTRLGKGLAEIAHETSVPIFQTQAGSMGCLFFHEGPIRNYADAAQSDTARYARFFRGMLERGVYLAPSQFEACFTSTAHTSDTLDRTLSAARDVFRTL